MLFIVEMTKSQQDFHVGVSSPSTRMYEYAIVLGMCILLAIWHLRRSLPPMKVLNQDKRPELVTVYEGNAPVVE
jgi:hypothetical protein